MSESTNPNPTENPPKKKKKSCLKIVGGVFLAFILVCILMPKDETGESSASEKVSKVEEASDPISESIEGDAACVDFLKKKWTTSVTYEVVNKFTGRTEKKKTFTIEDCMVFLRKRVRGWSAKWSDYFSPEGFLEGLKSHNLHVLQVDDSNLHRYHRNQGNDNNPANEFFGLKCPELRYNIVPSGGVVVDVVFKWKTPDSKIPGLDKVELYGEFYGFIWCAPFAREDKQPPEDCKFNDVIFGTAPKVFVAVPPSIEERKKGYTSDFVYGRRILKWKRCLGSFLVDRTTGEMKCERSTLLAMIRESYEGFNGPYIENDFRSDFDVRVYDENTTIIR